TKLHLQCEKSLTPSHQGLKRCCFRRVLNNLNQLFNFIIMKKKLHLTALAVCMFFLSLAGLNAQSLVASWEAEDFIGMGSFSNSVITSTDPSISGGQYLGKGKFSQSNSIFYYVNVAEAGWYNLTAYY